MNKITFIITRRFFDIYVKRGKNNTYENFSDTFNNEIFFMMIFSIFIDLSCQTVTRLVSIFCFDKNALKKIGTRISLNMLTHMYLTKLCYYIKNM